MDNFLALAPSQFCTNLDVNVPNEIMGYFDGNTVTALWNYAQHFAMTTTRSAPRSAPRRRAR